MNTEKFTGLANTYAKHRPSYSKELMDYLYQDVGFRADSTIADIGAGTGIFSKLLLERGSRVICVEPNEDMAKELQSFLSQYKNWKLIMSPAEQIPLPDKSVDFITAAQSFHWFDEAAFQKGSRRLLRDGGKVVLIWNSRIFGSEPIAESDAIIKKYCPNFKGFSNGMRGAIPDDHADFFENGMVERKTFQNDLVMDQEGFIGRHLSASYSPKEGDENYEPYIAALEALFHKYSVHGLFTMPNVTECYVGKV